MDWSRIGNMFRALRHRAFALLWTGQTISRIGDYLYEIALAWWVLEKTGSALAVGAVFAFTLAPTLLFLLIGGALVDRLPRLPVMLGADLWRGLATLALAALAWFDQLQLWQIYLISLTFGVTDAIFQPAYTAVAPQLVPGEDLPSANALTSLGVQVGRILGPALAATFVGVGGSAFTFALNGASFVFAAFVIFLITRVSNLTPFAAAQEPTASADAPQATHALRQIWQDIREGVSTVSASPILWISISIFALSNVTLAGPYSVAMPVLVKEAWGADARLLGILYAIFPAGYLAAGLLLGRFTHLRRRGLLTYMGDIVAGLGLLAFGLPLPLVVLGMAAFLNGAALEMNGQIWTNILQEAVPNEKLGRVASIDMLGSFLLLPAGFVITGWATEAIGPANVFLLGGGLTVLMGCLALTHPMIRRFD